MPIGVNSLEKPKFRPNSAVWREICLFTLPKPKNKRKLPISVAQYRKKQREALKKPHLD